MRRTRALSTLAVGAALVAAAPSRLAAQATPTTIRYVTSPSDDQIPFLYAQQKGLFTDAGLNIVAQRGTSGAAAVQAVIGGAVDVGKTSLVGLIAAHVRGVPLALIAPAAIHRSGTSINSTLLVAAASPLKTVTELQGKTLACTGIGDIGYLGTRALVDGAGGDSATVRWVELPTSAVAAAVEAGRVDGGISVEPYMTKDIETGKVRALVDILDGYRHPILEAAYFTTRDFANAHRDACLRFARVLAQAATYTNAHMAETIPLLVAATGMDPDTATKMHHALIATTFDPADIQPVIDVAARYKVIPERFDARDMIVR